MTIGERIKTLRESIGISQTELALAVGSTKQNIYKYENNIISNIPSDKIEAIAKALHTTPAYLMGWEGEKSTETSKLENVYLSFAKQAQEEGISPNDIKLAIDTIKRLRGG